MGYGIPQIICEHGKEAFRITNSFTLVTLPYDLEVISTLDGDEHLSEHLKPTKMIERKLQFNW